MRKTVVALTSVLLVAFAQSVLAQSAIETALQATVTIEVIGPDGLSHGSGFIVSSDGMIITAAHVIDGATSAVVRLQNGEELNVEGVIAIDVAKDFAIVRVAGFDLPTVPLGNADDLSVGQRIIVIGAPMDAALAGTISDGLLAADRLIAGTRTLQISAPTSPGNSGGPVLTEQGQVIGLVVSGINAEGAENLNFALPINYVRGQLALASSLSLQPLAEVQVTANAERARSSTGPLMNAGLRLDTDALHGTTLFRRYSDGTFMVDESTRYEVLPTPSGGLKIQQYRLRQYSYENRDTNQYVVTSFWNIDGSGAGEDSRGIVQDPAYQQYSASMRWRATGNVAVVDSAGVWTREFTSRPGVIPNNLLRAVMAAMDPLPVPGQVQFWNGAWDANQRTFNEDFMLVELTQMVEVSDPGVRVPEVEGASCGPGTKTREITASAIEILTGGLYYYLRAAQPHITLDTDDRACMGVR